MEKRWKVLPEINKEFVKKYPDLNRIFLQLLFNRGITSKEEIDIFFSPDYDKNSYDPFLFNDMEKVVELIINHIKEQKNILIYGDYDADGITASAVLFEVLSTLKANVDVYIPDRVSEGYGLNKEALDNISKEGFDLIITVDCGIVNKEEVEYAKKLGLKVVITDHHSPPPEKNSLPDCLIINALVENEKYPYKKLAGVGASFKVAKALIAKSKLNDDLKIKLEEKVLDLLSIGTVADCVPLLGENRVLLKKGLEILNQRKRVGLEELTKVAKINMDNELDSWNIGYQIAPRINASGRLSDGVVSFRLLVTKDQKEAEELAQNLNEKNITRQEITNQIVAEAESQININDSVIIVVSSKINDDNYWNEGVVGLVAGKICEKYYKPTFVITETEDCYKGSGRSIDGFDIIESVRDCSDLLDKFGGHSLACGFSLPKENLEKFSSKLKTIVERKIKGKDLRPKIEIDAEIFIKEINDDLIEGLQKFSPFGQNNPKPIFLTKEVRISDIYIMGKESQHIKFRIGSIWGVAFGRAEEWSDFKIGDLVDLVYSLEFNNFNGRKDIQMRIVDIKKYEL